MAGGPVDPTMPLPPDGGEGGEPALDPTQAGDGLGADATGAGGLPGAYDPTIAVPPVVPPGGGPGDGDGDEFAEDGDNRRKWLYGALAALGVVVLGVLIALLLSGGG